MVSATPDASITSMGKILVVDDEPSIVDLLALMLERRGHQVLQAYTAEQALQHAEQEHPILVLLDIFLPDGNGLEMMEELKQVDPTVGIIVMTGIGDDQMGRQALSQGAVDFIKKPLDFDHLGRIVKVATHNY